MAIPLDRMNKLLEQFGSGHRVSLGQTMDEGFVALMEAIPSYIDLKLSERSSPMHPDLDYIRQYGIGGKVV